METGLTARAFITRAGTLRVVLPNQPYEPEEGDVEVMGMVDVKIEISVRQIVSASVQFWLDRDTPVMETSEKPRFFVLHPVSGRAEEIEEIRFKNGSSWEAP